MQSVSEITKEIIAREGGYVNDPDDPGGATNFGVTIHTLKRLGLDLNFDGKTDEVDVKMLSVKDAERIFIEEYYKKPKIDQLPSILRASVFDMNVNSGAQSIKILQRLLNKFGQRLSVDGGNGPITIAGAKAVAKIAPDHLSDAYGIERRNFYYALADKRIASRKYARRRDSGKGGWITRAEAFISKRFHLSIEEHLERVSTWD